MRTSTRAVVAAGVVGSALLAARIYYGHPATEPWHKATGAILMKASPQAGMFCSGDLAGPDVLLTAGHCCQNRKAEDLVVYFGQNPLKHPGPLYQVTSVHQQPGYDPNTLQNDRCVLTLATAPPIAPVKPLPPSMAMRVGELGNAAGFGKTETGTYDQLLQTDVRIAWLTADKVGYGQGPPEKDGGFGGGPCFGDSGGPLFVFRAGVAYLAATTSSGDSACRVDGDSTRVDTEAAWAFLEPFLGPAPVPVPGVDAGVVAPAPRPCGL